MLQNLWGFGIPTVVLFSQMKKDLFKIEWLFLFSIYWGCQIPEDSVTPGLRMTGEMSFLNPGVSGLRFSNPEEPRRFRGYVSSIKRGVKWHRNLWYNWKYSQVYSKFSQSLDYNLLLNQFELFPLHFDLWKLFKNLLQEKCFCTLHNLNLFFLCQKPRYLSTQWVCILV